VTLPYAIEIGGRVILAESRLSATVLQEIDGKQTLLVFVPEGAKVQLMGATEEVGLLAIAPNGSTLRGSSLSVHLDSTMTLYDLDVDE
jgi:hypothetical protein